MADALERLADGDERLRMVTVTGVAVTPDLRHATVYLSSLTEASSAALAEHRAQVQGVIARQVRMKRTPQLSFSADPAVAHGEKVEQIIRHLHERRGGDDHRESPRTGDETPDGGEGDGSGAP